MLRGLREASSGWVGKTVMIVVVGFLVISFVIWGIGDIFRGGSRQTVATIGNVEISTEQFRQVYNDRLQQLSRQIGRPITPAQAQLFGFDQQLLGQLLGEAALDEQARAMKLGVSDKEVTRRIMEDPAFRGLSGSFDQGRFEQVIRQAGYTEGRYVAEQRKVTTRRQIVGAITGATSVPAVEVQAYNQFQNEQRNVEYVVLTRAAAGEIAPPSPEALEKYFNDRKVAFRAPEYRKIVVLVLSAPEIAKTITVSDADAKAVFETRKDRYSTPEKREIQQMIFPNEEEAKAAAAKIAGGAWFEQVAGERGLKPTDISLGLIPKSSISDKAIADAAFALKQGEVSEPVKGRFGIALLRVNRIEPARPANYDEVAGDIKKEIAEERAKAEASSRRDKLEDELAGGARLSEAAKKLGYPLLTIDAVDRSGRGPDGNPVRGLPEGTDILSSAFYSDVGVENDPVQVTGGFAWYEVAGITPPRDRTLEEVRAKVEAQWKDDEIASRLKAKAAEMVEKIKGGATLASLASEAGLKVETATGIKRSSTDPLPEAAVSDIFKLAKDAAGHSEGKDGVERVVYRVTDISTPAFDANSADAKTISNNLRNAFADELLAQYVARVEGDLGMTINRAALAQATNANSSSGN
jgi:peptidyl-prolyl cis-trans isomerase D